jgi:hypothetical protein
MSPEGTVSEITLRKELILPVSIILHSFDRYGDDGLFTLERGSRRGSEAG